jgi:tetratricopeptide (TPR) repeat protein
MIASARARVSPSSHSSERTSIAARATPNVVSAREAPATLLEYANLGLLAVTKPTATGNLASTPFCELLVYALRQGLSGSLVLECPDRSKHAVLFAAGCSVKARVADPRLRLGELLVAQGSIDADAQRAAESGAEGELFGQRLIAQAAVSAEDVSAALDAQLYEQIAWLARAPSATAFAYFDAADLLANWGAEPRQLDPLAAIWQAAQSNSPKERVAQACQGFGERVLRLHPASRIGRFGFGSRERPLLDVLRMKPQTIAELEQSGLCELGTMQRVLYVLALTRHLDTGEAPLGVTTGTRPIPVPLQAAPATRRRPSAVMPAVAPEQPVADAPSKEEEAAAQREVSQTGRFAGRDEIQDKHRTIENQNHYEVLDIEANATAAQVASAFGALARRFHPDRLSPDLAELKDMAMRVFSRVSEAHRTLSHASSREDYDRGLATGEGSEVDQEQAQVVRVLKAAEAFQKAEILLRKRDLEGAERFAAMAIAGDQDQPEYGALHAWIRARKVGATEADVSASLEVLKQAVSKQGNNVKIRYYFAGVLKLAGHVNAALREFRFVAENDPSNLDAARELRLHDIRKNAPPPEPAPSEGGLFGRLFKR